jgi:two-component system, LytTR family, response regulator
MLPDSTPKWRILIVDDEPLARERLLSFLKAEISVEIVGECRNGAEALASIGNVRADIVFMDVEMPGINGLQVIEEISVGQRPAIVLATAHERFALEAFSAQVVDYLLKPFGRDRFQLALARAIDNVCARRDRELGTRLASMMVHERVRSPERLAVRVDGRVIFLRPCEIIWVEAANNYSILHLVSTKRLVLRETLSSVANRLAASNFVRVNRSAIVQFDQVEEIQPAKFGDLTVVLRNGVRIPLSRSLRGRLEAFASG